MRQIRSSYGEIRNFCKEKVIVVKEGPRVPGYHKYAEGADDTEEFCKTMEEQIAVKAREIQSKKNQDSRQYVYGDLSIYSPERTNCWMRYQNS